MMLAAQRLHQRESEGEQNNMEVHSPSKQKETIKQKTKLWYTTIYSDSSCRCVPFLRHRYTSYFSKGSTPLALAISCCTSISISSLLYSESELTLYRKSLHYQNMQKIPRKSKMRRMNRQKPLERRRTLKLRSMETHPSRSTNFGNNSVDYWHMEVPEKNGCSPATPPAWFCHWGPSRHETPRRRIKWRRRTGPRCIYCSARSTARRDVGQGRGEKRMRGEAQVERETCYHTTCQNIDAAQPGVEQKEDEELLVLISNAVAEPRAVMIHVHNAHLEWRREQASTRQMLQWWHRGGFLQQQVSQYRMFQLP